MFCFRVRHGEAVSLVVARWPGGEGRILLSKFWNNSTTSSRWRGAVLQVKRRKKYRVKQFQQRCLVEIAQALLGIGSLTSKSGQALQPSHCHFNIKSCDAAQDQRVFNGRSRQAGMLKEVELQLTAMHELLLGALAKITCLEKELTIYKADCSVPRLHSQSSYSSQL